MSEALVRVEGTEFWQGEIVCWSCKKATRVYTWPGHEMWAKDGPERGRPATLKRLFSRTAGVEYLANTCEHCGRIQGDFFLFMESSGPFAYRDVARMSCYVCGYQDAEWLEKTGRRRKLHIHHVNWNHKDNSSGNRVWLCERCHIEVHRVGGINTRAQLTEVRNVVRAAMQKVRVPGPVSSPGGSSEVRASASSEGSTA
jgi:hypothetical protein